MVASLRYAARSDVGMVRPTNEDSGYAGSRMLVVADGMGGHAAGELASAAAVATFADLDVHQVIQPGDDEVLSLLAGSIDEAHDRIAEVVLASPEKRGMGTTVTALAWLNDRVAIAHIGDSRAYLLRDGVLTQLTRDHTFVQTLVDSGRITQAEAAVHERRNLLTRALDGVHEVDADLSIREVRAGDRFLLCSDGLHGVVPDELIAEVLTTNSDPTGAVGALVEEALAARAPDNVTALVADLVDVPEADADVARSPIVVGAAAERRNRERLPQVEFPDDAEPLAAGAAQEAPSAAPPPAQEAPAAAASRRRSLKPWLIGSAAVLVSLAILVGGWLWTRTQYYVGNLDGKVAVFQGISSGPGQHGLSTVESVSPTAVAELPEFERGQVEANIPASSVNDALRIVATLSDSAAKCRATPAPAGCPTPAPKPSATPSPAPSSSPSTRTSPPAAPPTASQSAPPAAT